MLFKAFLINFLSIYSPSEPQIVNTTIDAVTVYSYTANVERTSKEVTLLGDKSLLSIQGISPFIDQNSVQVKLSGEGVISSVKFRKNYLFSKERTKSIKAFKSEMQAMADTVSLLEIELEALSISEDFLKANKFIVGENGIQLVDLKNVDEYYYERLHSIFHQRRTYNNKIDSLKSSIVKLSNTIAQQDPSLKNEPMDLIVEVFGSKGDKVSLKINYQVGNAGWYTTYDLRAKSINEPIELIQKANVYQNTGEVWDEVKLSFSNENTNVSKTLPKLNPIYLPNYKSSQSSRNNYSRDFNKISGYVTDEIGEPLIGATVFWDGTNIGTATDVDGYYEIVKTNTSNMLKFSYIGYSEKSLQVNAAIHNVKLDANAQLLSEVVVVGLGRSNNSIGSISGKAAGLKSKNEYRKAIPDMKIEESELNFKFTLDNPYSINSDGKHVEISLQSIELPADFAYHAVPKINNSVYLTAYIDEWEDKNLLKGNMNLYFEGAYIGKSFLDPDGLKDSMQLSLGIDRKIIVERKRTKYFTKKIGLTAKKRTEWMYEINIVNQKSVDINIEISDQIPVSTLKEIAVEKNDDSSKFVINTDTGIGHINIAIPKKESKKLKIGYNIKYPSKYNFIL